MLKEERHTYILAALQRSGRVLAQELSRELAVSEDTIRRDLRELAGAGRLKRVHGGALPRSPAAGSFSERQQQAPATRAGLAAAAITLVQDGQVLLLDSGTTALEVARRLPHSLNATVVTPSPAVAMALLEHQEVEVILLGGRVMRSAGAAVGIETAAALRQVRCDLCVLGLCSLHPDIGITVNDAEEAALKRLMIAQSAEVVALATGEKLGTALPYLVAPAAALSYLVVERTTAEELIEPYLRIGIAVLRS